MPKIKTTIITAKTIKKFRNRWCFFGFSAISLLSCLFSSMFLLYLILGFLTHLKKLTLVGKAWQYSILSYTKLLTNIHCELASSPLDPLQGGKVMGKRKNWFKTGWLIVAVIATISMIFSFLAARKTLAEPATTDLALRQVGVLVWLFFSVLGAAIGWVITIIT